eukprot:TRINITY_DN81238_c0_g1_i1.p1 TRINITY_DN81238_c0_g1~~TRINITY_DN81238_c0_g1_i1.p1  ORF type:complete len:237 (+),score=64.42 TRINITY_DN81238_c0_g1_i1:95-712(+)
MAKNNKEFTSKADELAERATLRFQTDFANQADHPPNANGSSATGSPVQACKRMIGFLGRRLKGMGSKDDVTAKKGGAYGQPSASGQPSAATGAQQSEVARAVSQAEFKQNLDLITMKLQLILLKDCNADKLFDRWDPKGLGSVSPIDFTQHCTAVYAELTRAELGGIWRRADLNCDGQLDRKEFVRFMTQRPGTDPALLVAKSKK